MACAATRSSRTHLALILATISGSASAAGCVDAFNGSNLQIDFSQATLLPGGSDYDGLQAPGNTYFTFYAVDHVYALDDNGDPVLDADGDPVVTQSYLFSALEFELKPVIDVSSPCFIELASDAKDVRSFPGLHVTMWADKVKEDTGIDDPFDPPNGVTEGDISDVLNAERRMELLPRLQSEIKSLSSFSNFAYPAPQADCAATGDQLPAITCIDDASNAQRLRVCQALWADAPGFYEGSDKVFSLPLSGKWFGVVEGPNPVNAGFVGGSTVFVDIVLGTADAYTINWQFKDRDGDGDPDYPADFFDDGPDPGTDPDRAPSETGYPFMTGRPESRVRGVINTRMRSPYSPSAFAEVAIFSGLADDDVNF